MPFVLNIFQSEFEKIESFVLSYPNIETGGDLFGLWSRNEDPVVQLLIGPGAKCRRTSVSFHQDIEYLENVGTYLNTSFMLCHIGSWHSHHQLSLTQPSAGDRSTVCNNFPRGLQRYIMIIANIKTSSRTGHQSVEIHPYKFTSKGHVCEPGTVQKIPGPSPFMAIGYVMSKLSDGCEPSRVTAKSKPYNYPKEVKSPVKELRSPAKTNKTSSPYKSSSEKVQTSAAEQQNGYQATSEATQWYSSSEGEAKLQEINDNIRSKLNGDNVEFARHANSLNLSLTFVHNGRSWAIEFPESFDKEPARIRSNSVQSIPSTNIIPSIQKECSCRRCRVATVDEDVTAQLPQDHRASSSKNGAGKLKDTLGARSKSVRQERERQERERHERERQERERQERVTEKRRTAEVPWYKTAEGKSTLESSRKDIESFLGSREGKVYLKTNDSAGRDVSLTFHHERSEWIIKFPRNYPETPAKMYKKEGVRATAKFVCFHSEPLNVLETLKQKCRCQRCVPRSRSGQQRRTPSSPYLPSRYIPAEANDTGKRIASASVKRINSASHPDPGINQVNTPGGRQQWYSIGNGEKKLRQICTQISTLLLNGATVNMSRSTSSEDICLEFDYHHRRWRIAFPADYPATMPEIGYFDYMERYKSINSRRHEAIWLTIQNNCSCRSCKRHTITRMR